MTHPSFDLISKLEHADIFQPDIELQQSINHHVRHMPVFIPGEQIDMPHDQTATQFRLNKGPAGTPLSLPLYLREADIVGDYGQGEYFAAQFDLAILFAQSSRVDADLVDGTQRMRICHDMLLQMRDIGGAPDDGAAISEEEIAGQRDATLTFALRARAYCARHADIETLHLGPLTRPGVTPMLVGTLSAQRTAMHLNAFKELASRMFEPRWRCILFGDADGPANILQDLRQSAPCYRKMDGQGWLEKIKNKIEAPALALIGR